MRIQVLDCKALGIQLTLVTKEVLVSLFVIFICKFITMEGSCEEKRNKGLTGSGILLDSQVRKY